MRVRVSLRRMQEVRRVLADETMEARKTLDELLSRADVSLSVLWDAKMRFERLRGAFDYVDVIVK